MDFTPSVPIYDVEEATEVDSEATHIRFNTFVSYGEGECASKMKEFYPNVTNLEVNSYVFYGQDTYNEKEIQQQRLYNFAVAVQEKGIKLRTVIFEPQSFEMHVGKLSHFLRLLPSITEVELSFSMAKEDRADLLALKDTLLDKDCQIESLRLFGWQDLQDLKHSGLVEILELGEDPIPKLKHVTFGVKHAWHCGPEALIFPIEAQSHYLEELLNIPAFARAKSLELTGLQAGSMDEWDVVGDVLLARREKISIFVLKNLTTLIEFKGTSKVNGQTKTTYEFFDGGLHLKNRINHRGFYKVLERAAPPVPQLTHLNCNEGRKACMKSYFMVLHKSEGGRYRFTANHPTLGLHERLIVFSSFLGEKLVSLLLFLLLPFVFQMNANHSLMIDVPGKCKHGSVAVLPNP